MHTSISIIIPIYNAARFLDKTLSSIAEQSYVEWECLCVNDGSTDESGHIIDSWVAQDNRFMKLDISNSGNADIPISKGIEASSSSWCCFMGHDDVLESDYLQKLVTRQKETHADIVCGRLIGCLHELEGEMYRVPSNSFDMVQVITGKEACAYTIGGWAINCNGMLFSKQLYESLIHGAYMNSDEFTSRQILYKAGRVAFADAHYLYRQHNTSTSRAISPRYFERMYVDKQVEDYTLASYDEIIVRERAVTTRFFNLVHLTADMVDYRSYMTKNQLRTIWYGLKTNIRSLRKDELRVYLPKHICMFTMQPYIFAFMSLVYVAIKKMKHIQYEYK